jgi:hypothetical protein
MGCLLFYEQTDGVAVRSKPHFGKSPGWLGLFALKRLKATASVA